MRRGLYLRLALTNLVKNRRIYIPYLLTCICSIAMFYMIQFIVHNPGLDQMRGSENIKTILGLGVGVLAIFSVIFLIYSNGFLMKRRKKELGLYNILGMERRHIGRMLLWEMTVTALISVLVGILMGILGGKLMFLLLLRLINAPVPMGFFVSGRAIGNTLVLFVVIYGITLVNDLRQIHLVNPIELLQGGGAGEKEPKAKWLMALAGLLCMGVGYYLAWTTQNPLSALSVFFVAVLLVMAGTYLLFVAGSIAALKILRWNKKFYYQTRHFTSVSGLIYRMKQNAVGLANICILSTGVLLMISTTVCLYFGTDDVLSYRVPNAVNVDVYGVELGQEEQILDTVRQALDEEGVKSQEEYQMYLSILCMVDKDEIQITVPKSSESLDMKNLYVYTQEEYERITGEQIKDLGDEEILLYAPAYKELENQCVIQGVDYKVRNLKSFATEDDLEDIVPNIFLVGSERTCRQLEQIGEEVFHQKNWNFKMGIDLKEGYEDRELSVKNQVESQLNALSGQQEFSDLESVRVQSRQESEQSFREVDGGLFFLGIFLGTLFLMGTVLIIYYKQVSEGYEDQSRFAIMKKVGMSAKEVRQSIRSQVLFVFFLPLVMAICHIGVAFRLISQLMGTMGMFNTHLFGMCTVGTILVFALVYVLIYVITAKVYYKIVSSVS